MPRKAKDCGCGGGVNCITKATIIKAYKEVHPETRLTGTILAAKAVSWAKKKMENLDCGCGCKGKKGFLTKYLKGGALNECPPGYDNHGLTCLEKCGPDEFDDGLTCRKKCGPGLIDDGLTCRKPIESSMNSCPPGSRDIAGTCWGPVRRDCVDDCFKHPAPGCRTWECGRLRGLFGEDWGPRLCTDCNLRCGETCWDVQGITKQLHERELRVWGGEVYGQPIRGKNIVGRVNWNATLKELETGLSVLFDANGPLASAFDPEKNGVNEAFRKFGKDTQAAFEDIGRKFENAFDPNKNGVADAFKKIASLDWLPDDVKNKLKDPYFWVDFVTIVAQVGSVILGAAITVGTLGAGTGLAIGLGMALNAVGPAMKMIVDGATGKPIDALDIVSLAIALVPPVPGASVAMSEGLRNGLKYANYAAKAGGLVVAGTQFLQTAGVIPSTCISGCPPGYTEEPPLDPKPVEPPPGQPLDEELFALAPACVKAKTKLKNPTRPNPDACQPPSLDEWVRQYRIENYGPGGTTEPPPPPPTPPITVPPIDQTPVTNPVGDEFAGFTEEGDDEFAGFTEDVEDEFAGFVDEPVEDEFAGFVDEPVEDEFAGFTEEGDDEFAGFTEDVEDEFAGFVDEPVEDEFAGFVDVEEEPVAEGDDEFAGFVDVEEEDLSGLGRGGAVADPSDGTPAVQVGTREFKNVWSGEVDDIANPTKSPPGKDGRPFDVECYAHNYPDLANQLGQDRVKLTTWWNDIGHKSGNDPSCGADVSNKLLRTEVQAAQDAAILEAAKTACDANDQFWTGTDCDFARNKDGTKNTTVEECRTNGSWWDGTASPPFCNRYRDLENNMKTPGETCKSYNNHFVQDLDEQPWKETNYSKCSQNKNVDGSLKTEADFCTGMNNFWDGRKCIVDKDKYNNEKSNTRMCHDLDGFLDGEKCDLTRNTKGQKKDERHLCQVNNGAYFKPAIPETRDSRGRIFNEAVPSKCWSMLGPYPTTHSEMTAFLQKNKAEFKSQYDEIERNIIKKAFENGAKVFKDKNNE
jgi:hypothetical protein